MFTTVLVANRGEVAVRVFRTLRHLGVRSVAVFSDADAGSRHVREADVAVHIGPAAARNSYLVGSHVISAALSAGAEAIHPGYGFLAENAAFARACADAGLVFIGPPPEAIEAMGDKIRAKQAMVASGVPVVPGRNDVGMTDRDLTAAADEVGYPVLVKPAAGGGGKGMRLVQTPETLGAALASARREALSSFGDDTLFVERFVTRPRHIEIQVLGDQFGHVIHLGERECSLQRRHQKVIEEAPSPLLRAEGREAMGSAAVAAARAVDYTGAGTLEFIVSNDRPDDFYFMEMNTRLQVEHPVTELVTGVDLVEWQLRIAAGERLLIRQQDVEISGHAIEARVYAEDPAREFLPTGGVLLAVREPSGSGVRVDSGIEAGMTIGSNYDPMLAKVVAHGVDRAQALSRLDLALARTAILGVGSNIAFLRNLLRDPAVSDGRLHTGLIEDCLASLVGYETPDEVVAAAALLLGRSRSPGPGWLAGNGWRIGSWASTSVSMLVGGRAAVVVACGDAVTIDDQAPVEARLECGPEFATLTFGGVRHNFVSALDHESVWLSRDGQSWKATVERSSAGAASAARGRSSGRIVSPMPGTVVAVHVSELDSVAAGQPVAIVEAMKMEHTLVAPLDGIVVRVNAVEGQTVAMDEVLVEVASSDESESRA